MKLTANLSMLFTEVDLVDRFCAAKQAGFDAVEIQFPYSIPAPTLKDVLADNELKLVLFNVDAGDLMQGGEGLAAVPEKREQYKQALVQTAEYIDILRPEAINVLPGRCLDSKRLDAYLETFRKNLVLANETFKAFGVKTVFEAINTLDMPGFIIDSGAQMLSILAELNEPDLFLQYDIYHMTKMGEDAEKFILEQAARIGHIQFADNPGRGQPGTGQINFQRIFNAIRQSGYNGWVGAEYLPIGSTQQSLNWLLN